MSDYFTLCGENRRIMWIFFIFVCSPASTEVTDSLEKDFLAWANDLEKSLSELQAITGENVLHNVYRSPSFGKREMTEEAAFELLDKAAEKINNIVKQKAELVHKIKLAAEEAYRTRTHREPTGCYLRAKAIALIPSILSPNSTQNCSDKIFLDMERNALFENTYVSLNYSVAHVPTNVYDLSKTIVSVGNWTGALDAVFRENAATDPTLKWQYFGSSTGFFQFYPGSMWDIQLDELRLDFFDCRSQPWYLSASSYAKEMLILVDKSGSMKGRSDIISNATVTEILNTLTENDFFNIIMFTDTPRYADPAIQDRLIQAFKYNKDRMVRRFQNFNPNGTAHYERALTEAFSLMNKTRENQTNSKHCSQMLMIITDSVPDSYKELLEKLDPDKNVRIFVYLLGQHSYAEPYVEELACLNRGYAVTIATLADVKENVLKYLNVVARSNAILNHGFITWSGVTVRQFNLKRLTPDNFTMQFITPAYKLRSMHKEPSDSAGDIRLEEPKIDTMIALKEEEPVMYTSVAEAVYDRTKKAMRLKQGNLLGVAGIDVPLQSFRDALRGWQAGVNNYLFAVDNNGFVLFHPGYRPVYKSTLKSHYQNVDLNEVEVPQDVKIDPNTGTPDYATPLREAMIERERKTNELPAQIVTDNFHTTFQATRKFFSTPLEQTPFTLGLAVQWNAETDRGDAIPEFVGAKAMANEQVKRSEMDRFAPIYAEDTGSDCSAIHNHSHQGATLSPYQFCQFDQDLGALWQADPICALRRILLDGELQQRMMCDMDYLLQIRLDAKETQPLQKFWTQVHSSPLISKWGVQQAFSFHHSGLIRFHNFSSPVYPNFIKDHIFGVEDPLYAETVLTNQYFHEQKLTVFHPPPNDLFRHFSSQNLDVPIPMTMTVYNEIHQVPMAVVGLQITHHNLQKQFDKMTNTCLTDNCRPCGNEVDCYLINQAALVLVSSGGEKEVGQSLKEINCALVEHMVNVSVLKQYYLYDFQGICIEVHHGAQSLSSRLLAPFYSFVKLLMKSMQELILILIGLTEPLNPLPIFGQDWNFYRGPQPEEDRFTPQHIYNEALQPQNPITNFRSKNQHQTYMGSAQPESYGYGPDHSARKPLVSSEYSLNKPQSPFYGEEPETRGPDFSIPPLPSLESEKTDEIAENRNDTTAETQPSEPEEPELQEEPTDEILGRIDQDPYEAQLRALNAIEACRLEQTALIQSLFDTEQGGNQTEGQGINKTDRVLVPGSLLDCVHKSVQQRCRSSAGTSSLTGRYACEAVCAIVRERMPQLAGKIDDCRQPLTSCTERFVAFQVASRWIDPAYVSSTNLESDQIKANQNNPPKDYVASGEYCQECGTRRWHLKPIRGTNLFFLVDYAISGASSLSCKCNCKKRFWYGAQIKIDPTKPRPIRLRRDPPSPEVCTIIKASLENSTVCTDDGKVIQPSWVLLLIVATIQLLR